MSTIACPPALLMTLDQPSRPSQRRRASTGSSRPPLICTYCGGHFQRSNGLKRHMRIHTGERPYPCTHCDAAFTRTDLIRRHLLLNHGIDNSTSARPARVDDAQPNSASTSSTSRTQRPRGNAAAKGQQANSIPSSSSPSGSSHQRAPGSTVAEQQAGSSNFAAGLPLASTSGAAEPANRLQADWSQRAFDPLFDFMVPSPVSLQAPPDHSGSSMAFAVATTTPGLVAPQSWHHAGSDPTEWAPHRWEQRPQAPRFPPTSAGPGLNHQYHPDPTSSTPQQTSTGGKAPQTTPVAQQHHLRLFVDRFAKHVPCIHIPTDTALSRALQQVSVGASNLQPADSDLLLAMAIVGSYYDTDGSYVADLVGNLYGTTDLRARLAAALAEKGEEAASGRYRRRRPSLFASGVDDAADDGVLRRTQALLLLQFQSLCSGSTSHQNQARLLHGPLVSAGRDLLQQHRSEAACALLPFTSTARTIGEGWSKWAKSEERLRTVWMIYAYDALASILWHLQPLLSLAEISDLAPPCDEALWQASDASRWAERASALHRLNNTNRPQSHSAPGLSSYMGCFPGQPSFEGQVAPDPSALLSVATSSLHPATVFEAYSELFNSATQGASSPSSPLAGMPVTGMSLLVLSLCSEVIELGRMDHSARQQLRVETDKAPYGGQGASPSPAADRLDGHLRSRVQELEAALGRWIEALALVEDPFRVTEASSSIPFLFEPMPWYWAASHYLAQLRGRPTAAAAGLVSGAITTHGQVGLSSKMGQAPTGEWLSPAAGSTLVAGSELPRSVSPLAWPLPCTPQGPESVMRFLVQLRSSIRSVDGGASVLHSLGQPWTADREARAVAAAGSVEPASLLGFFPPLFTQP